MQSLESDEGEFWLCLGWGFVDGLDKMYLHVEEELSLIIHHYAFGFI